MLSKVIVEEDIMKDQDSLTLEHKRLGEISYRQDEIIVFPQGVLGFEKKRIILSSIVKIIIHLCG